MSAFLRTPEQIEDYAARLHLVDQKCKEDIPITAEEAYALQGRIIERTGAISVFDMHILGHRLKIL